MKRLFCMLLVITSISAFSQKEITVVSFKQSTSDISARTNLRDDTKGIPCALVKVQFPLRNALFEGDIIGAVAYKTNEYWVYMPQNSAKLVVRKAGYTPLNIDFKQYEVPALESKGTYELCIIEKEASAPQLFNEGMEALAKNDMVSAYEKLEKAADVGYDMANYILGSIQVLPSAFWDSNYSNPVDPNSVDSYQAAFDYYKKAADAGVPEGLCALGKFLKDYKDASDVSNIHKISVPEELCDSSVIWGLIKKAADSGVMEAQYQMLGNDQWCEENAKKGVAIAQLGMGLRNDEGYANDAYLVLDDLYDFTPTEDFVTAANWYKKAAEGGIDVAQWRLGEMYARGLGVEENVDKALMWRKKAAEQGNVIFQLIMAMSYNYGQISNLDTFQSYGTAENAHTDWAVDIPENPDEADYWLRKVSNHELAYDESDLIDSNDMYSDAMYILAEALEKKGEYEKAIYWYQRVGEKEGFYPSWALYEIGRIFSEGLAGKKDYAIAKRYLEQGANLEDYRVDDRGIAACYCSLGILYRNGLGVEKNIDKAKEYFLLSSNISEEAMSSYELGMIYKQEGDLEKAREWFSRGGYSKDVSWVDKGKEYYESLDEYKTKKMYELATMYYDGIGGDKDSKKAVKLFNEAASRGSVEAGQKLKQLGLPMPEKIKLFSKNDKQIIHIKSNVKDCVIEIDNQKYDTTKGLFEIELGNGTHDYVLSTKDEKYKQATGSILVLGEETPKSLELNLELTDEYIEKKNAKKEKGKKVLKTLGRIAAGAAAIMIATE